MTKNTAILFFAVLIMTNSCEDLFLNCYDCIENEPFYCDLEIDVSRVYDTRFSYQVTTYLGKVEDNIVIDERTVYQSFTINVPLNQEYSAVSVTNRGGYTYKATASAVPRVEFREDYCETPCYFITDNSINLRLKYY